MITLLSMSVWSMGNAQVVTFRELDASYNCTARFTWPVTYAEGADLAEWATQKAQSCDCFTRLQSDGWSIYVPIQDVSKPMERFRAIHNSHRTDESRIETYHKLAQIDGYTSSDYLG